MNKPVIDVKVAHKGAMMPLFYFADPFDGEVPFRAEGDGRVIEGTVTMSGFDALMKAANSHEEKAWLIERREATPPQWICMSQGVFNWTPNANEAMKFADRKSAEQIVELWDDVIITELSWPDGYQKAEPPPSQGCELPPQGWYCSREKGHEGPCAARRGNKS